MDTSEFKTCSVKSTTSLSSGSLSVVGLGSELILGNLVGSVKAIVSEGHVFE